MIKINGYGEIERLVEDERFKQIHSDSDITANLLADAVDSLEAAKMLQNKFHAQRVVLGYSAARKAMTAFFNEQGLRPADAQGSHATIIAAFIAQVGHILGAAGKDLSELRRLRNIFDYEGGVGATASDAQLAMDTAASVVEFVTQLVEAGALPIWDFQPA